MLNYTLIHNWMTGLGFPESMQQFIDVTTDREGQRDLKLQYSDATLAVLNSNYNEIAKNQRTRKQARWDSKGTHRLILPDMRALDQFLVMDLQSFLQFG